MEEVFETKNIGLRGIKVADTRISDVDGEKGILIYRGFNIGDIAQSSTFEEVSFLLLHDRLPTQEELRRFQSDLVSEREVPEAVYEFMKMMPKSSHPMDILQASVSILASYDPQLRDESRDANFKKALGSLQNCPISSPHGIGFGKGKNLFVPTLPSPMQETSYICYPGLFLIQT
jgi:citrate synthase